MPWHDPALPLGKRVELADGRPKPLVLMAAMAQLDCGACGYDCQTYAQAIDTGDEADLTKCAPGGNATAKKLKELVQLTVTVAPRVATQPATQPAVKPAPKAAAAPVKAAAGVGGQTYDRNNPYDAILLQDIRLNAPESDKDTRHVVFDLAGSGLTYEAGDALGVYPQNRADLVHEVLDLLAASGAERVPGRPSPHESMSLLEALTHHYAITRTTPALLKMLAEHAADAGEAKALADLVEARDADTEALTLADVLKRFPSARPKPAVLAGTLSALRPRMYSISSSLKYHPDEVHLTVGVVRYTNAAGRPCHGVASAHMADALRPGQRLRVFVHKAPHFRLPADPDRPVIMIGPGAGIAPFRAFLEERSATAATGKNWLFFGDRYAARDALYADELAAFTRDGVLHRLDTAYSRDGEAKCYVQHRLAEHAADVWRWLGNGAHLYVCGDARRMASDVHDTLTHVVASQGGMSADAATAYLEQLQADGRYQRDVY